VLARQLGQRGLAAADQDRLDLDAVAVAQEDAALLTDREDRPHQVLPVAHPAGGAVHDDADALVCHEAPYADVGRPGDDLR
jgi:hypothetical protein